MSKLHFVTFGQSHAHSVNGKTVDKDTVAVFPLTDDEDGRALAFETFGTKFCFEYPESYWDTDNMKYFPKGYVTIGFNDMTDDQINEYVRTVRHGN